MAYQAKRRKQFTEDFELVDESGIVIHTLHVSLDADDMLPKINRKYTDLMRVVAETTELKRKAESNEEVNEAYETLGRATTALYEAVFGVENAAAIIDFYNNRYIEMCKEVTPFIIQVVIPRCTQIKKENQDSILHSYKQKPKRAFLRR